MFLYINFVETAFDKIACFTEKILSRLKEDMFSLVVVSLLQSNQI
jgi:hypothetical protein